MSALATNEVSVKQELDDGYEQKAQTVAEVNALHQMEIEKLHSERSVLRKQLKETQAANGHLQNQVAELKAASLSRNLQAGTLQKKSKISVPQTRFDEFCAAKLDAVNSALNSIRKRKLEAVKDRVKGLQTLWNKCRESSSVCICDVIKSVAVPTSDIKQLLLETEQILNALVGFEQKKIEGIKNAVFEFHLLLKQMSRPCTCKNAQESESPPDRESDDVLEQLKLVCNDPLKVRQVLESQNMTTIANVIASLLADTNATASNNAKRRKKAHNRPRMLNELFVEVMLFMDRDSLDSMQLACRFMRDYIREREANDLPLRRISEVILGDIFCPEGRPGEKVYWLPVLNLTRRVNGLDEALDFGCAFGLLPYLRLAYCESMLCSTSHEIACGMLFDGLNERETHVNSLRVYLIQGSVDLLNRCINSFKSVNEVTMVTTSDELEAPETFNEAFFASLANRGIRYFDSRLGHFVHLMEIDAETALTYIFAEPMTDVSRQLSGIELDNEEDFLKLVRKKAGDLDSRQRVDLEATIDLLEIDPAGFEKYEKGEGKWIIDDLENGVQLEIEQWAEELTAFIHVYSST